jgi:3-dehydroquinate synthetase
MLARAGLPTAIEGIEPDAIVEALERDKKRDEGGVRFVLLSAPGEPREGERVEPDRVRRAIEELLR